MCEDVEDLSDSTGDGRPLKQKSMKERAQERRAYNLERVNLLDKFIERLEEDPTLEEFAKTAVRIL